MSDGDQSIDEKRVYGDRSGATAVLVATGTGLVSASVSGDLVGRFGVVRRGDCRDVAVGPAGVVAAVDDDVLVAPVTALAETDPEALLDGDAFESTGFGPAVAVGCGAAPVAADAAGRVARYDGGSGGDAAADGLAADGTDPVPGGDDVPADGWTPLGGAGDVRAVDGSLLATAGGVRRVAPDLPPAGLSDARDVADARMGSQPLAATDGGLYRLANGWVQVHDAPATAVSAAGARARAVVDGDLSRPEGDDPAAEAWVPVATPVDEDVADVAVTPGATYAVTDGGTLLVTVDDGWRTHPLGVTEVRRVAPRG